MEYNPSEPVGRGFALLTEQYGENWTARANLETLDISDWRNCLLAQVGGDYDDENQRLARITGMPVCERGEEVRFSVAYGFDAPDISDPGEYDGTYAERCAALTAEWKRVIAEG